MFYLSLPTAVISLILTPLVLPKTAKPQRPTVDGWGLLSMAIWVVALLLAVTQGSVRVGTPRTFAACLSWPGISGGVRRP